VRPANVTASNEDRGRFSARRKTKAILRLLRGEDIDVVYRELGVTAATVAGWRGHFLAGGQAALKTRSQTRVRKR
jgi:Helix-turn-helix domain